MRSLLIISLMLFSCSAQEEISNVSNTPSTEPGNLIEPPKEIEPSSSNNVSPADWKVKTAEEAKMLFSNCQAVKDGKLTLIVESEASPGEPAWTIGLQIPSKDSPAFLDHCELSAVDGKIDCAGNTCP